MKIAIIIPTYNEKENLKTLVNKILELELRLRLTIVDDNSPDGTGEIADNLAKIHKGKILVVHRKGKLGLGSAYKAGFKKAYEFKAHAVITMDADLSHDPRKIQGLLNGLRSHDVVVGSRYTKGGKIIGFSVWRTFLSSSAQFLCRFLLGIKIKDSTSGFRCYKVSALKEIKPETIKSEGYSFLIEAIYRAHKLGFSISEVPITFGLRKSGHSKVSQSEILKALLTVVRLRTHL